MANFVNLLSLEASRKLDLIVDLAAQSVSTNKELRRMFYQFHKVVKNNLNSTVSAVVQVDNF
jgi:hypothetical protein